MKEKFYAIKNAITKKNKSRYGLLLSVVALIEVLMILLVSTYSWVETISSIKITNAIGKIDTYTYTNAEIGTGSGYSGTPINLEEYFRASGNVHLATASSADGDNFFFPQVANAGASSNSYRKGTINDKNTNYIRFSFRVKAVGTSASFYFDKVPTFKIGGTEVTDNSVRLAISISDSVNSEGSTSVYSYNAVDSENVVANVDGTKVTTTKIHAFSDYDNNGDDDSNILFTVPKDGEKIITLTLWLQDSGNPETNEKYSGKTVTCGDFKLVTGVKTTKINFVDRTSAHNSSDATSPTWQWASNDNAKIWVYAPSGNAYEMTKVVDENNKAIDPPTWTLTVASELLGDSSGDFYFYRTASDIDSNPQNNYYNFWKTTLSSAGTTAIPTYTAFGNTKSGSVEGYGTWSDVAEIKVLGDNAENVLKTPGESDTPQNVTLNTAAAGVTVQMNYNNNFWRAFIPNDSDSVTLTLKVSKDSTTYTIPAGRRDSTESASTFRVTSSTTGYWEEPAIVQAIIPSDYTGMGSVTVSGGPSGATTVKVTKGTTVKLTATPASDDYAFEGWYSDAECTKSASTVSQFNITASEKNKTYTYYAKFQFNVRLTAKTDGVAEDDAGGQVQINDDGTPGAKVSLPVQKGGSVKLIALPNTEDYEFMGWYDSESKLVYDNTQTTVEITNLQKPINLYAVYDVKKFVLEAYAATNGVKEDATGGTVKFDSQTASSAYATVEVAYTGEATFVAVVKETDGYEFVGWYSDEACTKLVTTELTYTANKNTENKTLYAKFVLKKYDASAVAVTNNIQSSATGGTVKVTADGVTTVAGATATTKVTHGTTATFTAVAKSGYNFVGWYDKATGGTLVSDEAEYSATGVAGDIKLYAIFKKVFTVTLTARTDGTVGSDGGTVKAGSSTSGATSTANVNYGDSITIVATPVNASYSFVKWCDASDNSYGSTTEVTLTNVTSNISLYGDFVKKTFTIKAYAVSEGIQGSDGGTVSFTTEADSAAFVSVTVDYDGSATFKAFVNSSDGYEFKGWHEKADCSDTAVSTLSEYTLNNIQDNKTLYAEFTLKRYTVTAVAVTTEGSDGGTVAQIVDSSETQSGTTINIDSVTHNSTVTLKAKPIENATFEGWYDAETGGNRLDDPASETLTITVTDNQTVYARFKVTDITTTIYFAERSGYTNYYAYIYDKTTTSEHPAGDWPGTKMSKDEATGYYKLTFTTSHTGSFRAIVNNGSGGTGNQYPTGDGLEGTYGKTYLFGDTTMTEYNPVSVTLNAVSVNASGVTQSNGFTGGSITVDGTKYTAAKTLSYNSGSSFTATAAATGNYKFTGWYDNSACTGTAVSTNAALTVTLTENKTYYAKFVEQANVTITFDASSTTWVSDSSATMFVFDNSTSNYYQMTNSSNTWTASVPSSVSNITFYRCTSSGFNTGNDKGETYKYWNKWSAGDRGTKTTYKTSGDGSGSWQ
ncbi:MAG: InlB B-repeat-containing protein [Ruminococcus sp.]